MVGWLVKCGDKRKMQNIVLPQASPVLISLIDRMCLRDIITQGYTLEILDFSYLVNKKRYEDAQNSSFKNTNIDGITVCEVKSKQSLKEYVAKHSDDCFWLLPFHNYFEVRSLFRYLSKYGVKYGYINGLYAEPGNVGIKENHSLKIRLNPAYIIRALYYRLLRKVWASSQPEFVAISSKCIEEYILKINGIRSDVKRIYLHTYDYENFMKVESYIAEKPYCVFLDQYYPYHPDEILSADGTGVVMEPRKYYHEINSLLGSVKQLFGIDIIIAAHPRADYTDKPFCWNDDWTIMYGSTAALVKGASLVVAHDSNAITFAVMARCPIILYASEYLKKHIVHYGVMKWYSNELDIPLLVEGESIDKRRVTVNQHKYDEFLRNRVAYDLENSRPIYESILHEMNMGL